MNPIKLEPDQQITEDGVYLIPIERYHHDPNLCDGPSISSSGLRTLITCPAKYWAYSIYNPDRREPEEKQVFAFGKAAHALILEGELPPDQFQISPFDSFRTNEAKAWKAEMQAAGITILKEDDMATIADIRQALLREPLIQSGLFDGAIECSLVWRDKKTGIWLKSRPDTIPNDDTLVDAKFVADASPRALSFALADYGYHMQFALGMEGMAVVLKRVIQNCAIVACEKKYPHVTQIGAVDPEALEWGARLNRQAIDEFADRMSTGDWPGYEPGPITIFLPDHVKKRLEANKNIIPEVPSLEEMTHA
jgi:hypothetical protein